VTIRLQLTIPALLSWSVAGIAGCRPHNGPQIVSSVRADSLIGIVSVTGTTYETEVFLRVGNRYRALSISGSDSAALRHVGGVEVVARGRSQGNRFLVVSFTVLSVEGRPVRDGIVLRTSGHLALQTTSGPQVIESAPAALYSMIGARVWIGGASDTSPPSYGVIVPAP
jgi:hypothetical protein